jgi:hypothetical protein
MEGEYNETAAHTIPVSRMQPWLRLAPAEGMVLEGKISRPELTEWMFAHVEDRFAEASFRWAIASRPLPVRNLWYAIHFDYQAGGCGIEGFLSLRRDALQQVDEEGAQFQSPQMAAGATRCTHAETNGKVCRGGMLAGAARLSST